MVWQTSLQCHPHGYKLQDTTIIEKAVLNPPPGQRSTWSDSVEDAPE